MLDIHEFEYLDAYESAQIYKERTNACHDQQILKAGIKVGHRVLLFNSRLRLFSRKINRGGVSINHATSIHAWCG